MEKEQIIIDCDPGSDDALAIILALHSEKIDLKAVCSVTGNGALDTTTRNGCNILSLCGRKDIPLYRGSGAALDERFRTRSAHLEMMGWVVMQIPFFLTK